MTKRRSGNELTEIIYQAAIKILNTQGYEKVTFATVAKEAQTSRTVLYRRWNSPLALLLAAVHSRNKILDNSVKDGNYDTGSLRGDLFALCNQYRRAFNRISEEFLRALLLDWFQQSEPFYQNITTNHDSNLFVIERIFVRAQLRGELTTTTTDYVKLLPFKLLRYELLTSQGQVPEEAVTLIIDEVILPAIMAQQTAK